MWRRSFLRLVSEVRSTRRSLTAELTRLTDAVNRLTYLLANEQQTRGVNTSLVIAALLKDPSFLETITSAAASTDPEALEAENLAALGVDDESLAQADLLEAAERRLRRPLSLEERDDLLESWAADVSDLEVRQGRPGGPAPTPARRASTRQDRVPYIP
jgi:hypothetical protein